MQPNTTQTRVALIEAGSPGLNIYSHVAMGRGITMLASVLAGQGVSTRAFVEDISGKGSVDWEYVASAHVVGFSVITCTLTRTAELIGQTRRVNPCAVIVLGGPEPTFATPRAFEAGADYVLKGESELTLPRFVREVTSVNYGVEATVPTHAMREIPGLVWRGEDGLEFGPPERQLTKEEVDSLPSIETSLIHGYENATTGLVWRARGCPERCSFCEVHKIWPRYVVRNEDRSLEELMRCQSQGRGGVFLIDDNAAANKPAFKRFLRKAIEAGYHRPIAIQLRADAVLDSRGAADHEFLSLLRDVAPFTVLCVGIESAEDEDLEAVGKNATSERVAVALKAMRRYGLLVHAMMIAFADDTAEALRRNGAYARKYATSLQYLFETPLPGTHRTMEFERAGRTLWRDLEHLRYVDGMHVSVLPKHMEPSEMQSVVVGEYRRFYSRVRMASAAVQGLLFRRRHLPEPQRRYLADLNGLRRVREWAMLHLQYKFAPLALLRTGRDRMGRLLRDSDYLEYLDLLQDVRMKGLGVAATELGVTDGPAAEVPHGNEPSRSVH